MVTGADAGRPGPRLTSRRSLLVGGAGVAGAAALAGVAAGSDRVRRALGVRPDAFVPDAAEGRVRLERVSSRAMGGDISLFTAVPAGHGAGRGLPVVVVLHAPAPPPPTSGASGSPGS